MPVKTSTEKKKEGSVKENMEVVSGRVMIEKVYPEIDGGKYPVKRVPGEQMVVRANVFTDGHETVTTVLLYKKQGDKQWKRTRMKALGNDSWAGSFMVEERKDYLYTLVAALDRFGTWRKTLDKKYNAGQDIKVEMEIGSMMVLDASERASGSARSVLRQYALAMKDRPGSEETVSEALSEKLYGLMLDNIDADDTVKYGKELRVSVEREKALFSSWYEFFPRSWAEKSGRHGTFKEAERVLPEIARMGFDVVYLPPVHPIGRKNRKGKNNSTDCKPAEPGCPWAIGSREGGHKSINPDLGTMKDFERFLGKVCDNGMELAMDLAFQCSPDHPYVKEHPEWFIWRPDGSVQFAENPPKKYEDVLPINFDTNDKKALWTELKSVVEFWIGKGVKIFRVDNPHTKPFPFWDWLISEIKQDHPEVLFLAEAFTRPNVMYRLAKGGFSQSYTYFTWRMTKRDFTEYMTELTQTEAAEIMRPNFWPNTPDILPEHLQYGGRPMFIVRAVLASTLSSNFGIYGPAFELCVSEPVPDKEEYLDSEKYEIKKWNWDEEGNLKDLIARLNSIRRQNPALHMTRNIRFCEVNNDNILCYYKATGDYSNIILVVVNLDPYHIQPGTIKLPASVIGDNGDRPYLAHDLLSGDRYIWQGEYNYVELDPQTRPAHIIKLRRYIKNEQDFDYFM